MSLDHSSEVVARSRPRRARGKPGPVAVVPDLKPISAAVDAVVAKLTKENIARLEREERAKLVDDYAAADAAYKAAAAEREKARAAVLDYVEECRDMHEELVERMRSTSWHLTIAETIRSTVDLAAVKAALGDEWVKRHSKSSVTRTLKLTNIEA